MQCHSSASSALPNPPKKPAIIQQATPVTGFIPLGFTYASDVRSLGLGQNFELISLPLYEIHYFTQVLWIKTGIVSSTRGML